MHLTRKWMMSLMLSVALFTTISGLPSQADCGQHASKAKLLLTNFKQSAMKNEHPDSEQFKAQFEPLINAMQKENCMNELMKVFQFVQAEQQLYPAPGSPPPGFDD
jgi:hypothetical protein